MKRCLCPAHPLRPSVSSLPRRALGASLHSRPRIWRSSPGRRQWGRQYSVDSSPPPFDRKLLFEYTSWGRKKCLIPYAEHSDLEAWITLLEQYLPPSLRRHSQDADVDNDSPATTATTPNPESFAQTIELHILLLNARSFADQDLLAHLGFRLNNWPAVRYLTNRLLDAADALNAVSVSRHHLSDYSWGRGTGLSLDQLTDQSADSAPRIDSSFDSSQVSKFTTLNSLTERPYPDDHSKRIMAEMWQSLGSIVLDAADASPNESRLAMSYVFQTLARLHHSGAVADRVYKYVPPTAHQAVFRPPGMHLLSNHIMNVLSDAAWLVHEAEVAAQAAAAGEDAPYLPFRMGIRELGPEIWLEFILWCCVEHGHIKEGAWLVDRMKRRTGDLAWKFESWKPLLKRPESVWKTPIDQEEFWRRTPTEERASLLRKRATPPPFSGLGKRTISLEVATALLDNVANQIYLGMGFRGLTPTAIAGLASSLKFAMTSATTDDVHLSTNMESNRFVVRVVESLGLILEVDPRAFEDILSTTPHVVPPWNLCLDSADEEDLKRLQPSQIYDESWAMAGLIEYNARNFSLLGQCGDAINAIERLQRVIDASKKSRIDEFFSQEISPDSEDLPVINFGELVSLLPLDTSMPQLSVLTMARFLDVVTMSRAFPVGEWLLMSNDIDGPPIPLKLYGNQALAPSIIRFATATKNLTLCDTVVQSLSQPLSINVLRALMDFRISARQWASVVFLLEYLRDFRLKSWSHSNVLSLAAELTRIEHEPAETEGHEENLAQAKSILLRVLNGEFNEARPRATKTNYQHRSLYRLHQVFLSLPGSQLYDVAKAATLEYTPTTHSAIPHIPTAAFHTFLCAIVDTQGCAAGKSLWDQWCVDIQSPSERRRHRGGISRFYLHEERDLSKGDPHFDEVYFQELQRKATIPNPNTVRVISQAAIKEMNDASSSSRDLLPSDPNSAIAILQFCARKFEAFNLRRREVEREVVGIEYDSNIVLAKKNKMKLELLAQKEQQLRSLTREQRELRSLTREQRELLRTQVEQERQLIREEEETQRIRELKEHKRQLRKETLRRKKQRRREKPREQPNEQQQQRGSDRERLRLRRTQVEQERQLIGAEEQTRLIREHKRQLRKAKVWRKKQRQRGIPQEQPKKHQQQRILQTELTVKG